MTSYDTAVFDLIKASFDVIDSLSAAVGPFARLEAKITKLHQALAALDGAPKFTASVDELTRDIAQQLLDAQRGGHKMTEKVCQWAEYVLRRDTADELTAEAQRLGLYGDDD